MTFTPRVAQLVHGSEVIDLTMVGQFGDSILSVGQNGLGQVKFAPHQTEMGAALDTQLFAEQWALVLHEQRIGSLSSQVQRLIRMLRAAWLFHYGLWETTPTYLVVQLPGEAGVRSAIVHSSPSISGANPLFNVAVEDDHSILDFGVTINRFVWQNCLPNTLPTITTLTKSDAETDGTLVHVSNFRDTIAITHIYNFDDSGGVYSANLAGTHTITLWPAATAVDDAILIGSTTGPLHTVVVPIKTAGVFNATVLIQIWTGAAFVTLAAGTEYTMYPSQAGAATGFTTAEDWVINIFDKTGWTHTVLNGVDAWWIKIKLNPFVSMTTRPVTSDTVTPYAQHDPYIAIPAAALKGDVPAKIMLRLGHPAGGASTPVPGITSRILIGAKSRGLDKFVSQLNLGNAGNPGDWATAYGTDTAALASFIAPQNALANITFATDATQIVRVTLTGTAMAPKWEGRYRVFVLASQQGGAAGDCFVMVRARMIDTTTHRPKFDTPEVATTVASPAHWEVMDLGTLRLPLAEDTNADVLTTDLLFQILARRAGGASTLYLGALILLPIDEWSTTLDDPVSDPVTGPSALRGQCYLDMDGGLIRVRAGKHIRISGVDTLMEAWLRDGMVPLLEPRRATRLFFLMLHYPTTFGVGPLQASLGQHLTAEFYTVARYLYLRGDE